MNEHAARKQREVTHQAIKSVEEIERAIAALTPYQLAELYAWLDQYELQPLQGLFEGERQSGRLDNAIVRLRTKSTGVPSRSNSRA
jgi:hypothetical protein